MRVAIKVMSYEKKQNSSPRTPAQNRAIHKLFSLWANALNDAGKDMLIVLKDRIDIPWTGGSVEQYIWSPIAKDIPDLGGIFEKMTELLANYIEVDQLPTVGDIFQVSLKKGLRIYYNLVADALNDAGADMRVFLPQGTEVWWSKDTVKDFLWKPVQKLQFNTDSTKQLLTNEIDPVYDTVNRHLGKYISTIYFPSIEDIIRQQHYD